MSETTGAEASPGAEASAAETAPGDESPKTDEGGPGDERSGREAPVPFKLLTESQDDSSKLISGAVLMAAGVGVLLSRPALLLVSVVGVGLLALRRAGGEPTPTFTVNRSVSEAEIAPGETVTVETTIQNVGDRALADCRFIDHVPDEAVVVGKSPRLGTALRPDESCTIQYEIRIPRGRHTFDGVTAILGTAGNASEWAYELESWTTLTVSPDLEPLQEVFLRKQTTPYAGRLPTDRSGEGLEFHSVREYRKGDSLRRIDWNQYASTGELATLMFRTERSASVVLIADVRKEAYVRGNPEEAHAADRCIDAVGRLFVTLLERDHRVGVSTFGPDYWLAPDDGTEHRQRCRTALGSDPAFSPTSPDSYYSVRLRTRRLLTRLSPQSQVIICSPLVDDEPEIAIQMLESAGHQVTVVSPDPTTTDTPGEIVGTLERRHRIQRIYQYGVPVVDWARESELGLVIARTAEGWAR